MRFSLALLASVCCLVASARVSYEGAKALRVSVGEDIMPLMEVIQKLDLQIWKGAPDGVPQANSHVDLVVTADQLPAFDRMTASMATQIMHADLGASMAAETAAKSPPSGPGRKSTGSRGCLDVFALSSCVDLVAGADISWFNEYHAYADHLTFLDELAAWDSRRAAIVTSGTSAAGRPITGIHIWGSAGKGVRPAVVLHGTVHAREWITTMTTEYLAYSLLSQYASSGTIKSLVDKYDFYIFPVVNPDGFVYSQTHDRLWRKNRQTVSTSICVGRDINRNWPYQWDVKGGASSSPCSEAYKGVTAGDAVETKVLQAFIDHIATTQTVQLYIDIHSYSQLIMTPYGYSCTAAPAHDAALQKLASGASAAIAALYGTRYAAGPMCDTLYRVSGSSIDYVADVTGAKYAFTLELRDTGYYGFVLPASQILPIGEETWAGFRYLLLNME